MNIRSDFNFPYSLDPGQAEQLVEVRGLVDAPQVGQQGIDAIARQVLRRQRPELVLDL